MIQQAIFAHEEFYAVVRNRGKDKIRFASIPQNWTSSPTTTVKINFVAAVSVKRYVEAVAALARNSQGLPSGWSCKLHPAIVDPLFLETLAGQEDVFLTHRMGLRSIILEGDAKQVIHFVKGRIFMETLRG